MTKKGGNQKVHVPFFQVPKSMGLPDPPKIEENKKADMAVTNHVF